VGAALSAQRVLAGKWSVPVLLALADGPLRYNRLLERLDGVSRRMLTATLLGLAADGLIERRVLSEVPRRVEYRLSPAGDGLVPVLLELSARLSRPPVAPAAAPAAQTRRPRPDR
jgi:DNA-binding HxlR family transcriptional regulator